MNRRLPHSKIGMLSTKRRRLTIQAVSLKIAGEQQNLPKGVMTALKWVQLFSTFVLILLPAAIHYRNWKHSDRRTKIHKTITALLLGLWICSAIGVCLGTYQDFSRKEKAPHFRVFVNGLPVGNDRTNYLTFPFPTNAPAQIVLSALNDGSWPAENFRIHLQFPPPPGFRIKSADGWQQVVLSPHGDNGVKTDPHAPAYRVECEDPIINVNDEFSTPPIVLEWVGGVNYIQIGISAKNMPYDFKLLVLHYKEGINEPYVGF